MNKVFEILLVSCLMVIFAISGSAFAKNWNTSNESTLADGNKDKKLFKSAEHGIDWENQSSKVSSLNQLFYPKEILAGFSKISQSKKMEFCKFKGDISQLNSIKLPKYVSGLNSRMKGSKNVFGVNETAEFVRIFNNLAAKSYFFSDNTLANELIEILYNVAKKRLLTGNKMCVKNGRIICKMDWNDKEGLDKTGIRDSYFVYNRVLIMAYVYHSYLYNEEIQDNRHQVIENWFDYFIKEGKKPKFELGQHGGWSIPAIAYRLIKNRSINGKCFGSDCTRILDQIFLNIDEKISDDGSIYPNTYRGDRALYYHNDAINEALILLEIGRSFGYTPPQSLIMKIERSILLFIKGYENHSFMDKWANEGIKGRVRPGVQDFGGGEKSFNNNSNSSWYHIFTYRYPASKASRILINEYGVHQPHKTNSDMRWGLSYKCPYNLLSFSLDN